MRHFLAIIEDHRPDQAVGVWFTDVPGCFSAGDTFDEAMSNAPLALAAHMQALRDERLPVPMPRTMDDLRRDPEVAADIKRHIAAE
jgi:predicted RNase H-like HicB family nuclease